jgi:hypothetical protein
VLLLSMRMNCCVTPNELKFFQAISQLGPNKME